MYMLNLKEGFFFFFYVVMILDLLAKLLKKTNEHQKGLTRTLKTKPISY